ncbi:chromosomal replication initiator protein DnaA [Agitococcus lubricus]|uniref:Chromosomal replication initiator protein DnaA n=1 Tax=Agitococcus lubricus TaxID=1077255 RepID=A0A2T5J3Q9_9GAMM|nr:chromosomal replication initiator protein DnaA [Agitococcus lubricus]PTQ91231.1 chromosomal replication initiator protein DnaA [Agitococcus lubricus]
MIWTLCLDRLQDEMPANLFGMWIRPLQVEENDTTIRLLAPNPFFRKHIAEKYLERIRLLAADFSQGRITNVSLEVGTKFVRVDESVVPPSPPLPSSVVERPKTSLNEGFTFDNFVQGKANQMAYAACQHVISHPAATGHNPLFLYGATGLGKTHLMQAVGHALLQRKRDARVLYLTSEKFVGGFVAALQRGALEDFKKSCRALDLLLIDDIHFLAGKGASLEEFFYTFNSLLENKGQIILTSDRYPKEIPDLDEQLKSRFSWGLAVELEPPDLETRVGILRKKAEINRMELPKPAALFIAQHIQANVRELEGALNKVIATARFQGRSIDIDIVKNALKDVLAVRARQINIDSIQKVVAEYYRIPLRELTGHKRLRLYARPRQIAMALARELTGESYPDIGLAFEGRDHSTVMHACEKVDELRKLDKTVAEDYHNLIRSLHG